MNLSAFSNFSSHSTQRKAQIAKHGLQIPASNATRWHYKFKTISVIYNNYEKLIEIFSEITDNACYNTTQNVNDALGLINTLENPLFAFLLSLFYNIFGQTNILFEIFQNIQTSVNIGNDKIQNFLLQLENVKNDASFLIHKQFSDKFGVQNRFKNKIDLKQLYFQIIDLIIQSTKKRFSEINKLNFVEMASPKNFDKFNKEFPSNLLNNLTSLYPFFEKSSLEAQLRFIFCDDDFKKHKSTAELLKSFYDLNLSSAFPEVAKFLQLVLTIGVTTSSSERSFSRLKIIKTYCRNPMGQSRLSALGRIAIWRELVKDLESRNIHELVVGKFCEEIRRLEYLYK